MIGLAHFLLLTGVGALCSLDTVSVLQGMLSRPIVSATLGGAALGRADLSGWIWAVGTVPVVAGLLVSMIRDFLAGRGMHAPQAPDRCDFDNGESREGEMKIRLRRGRVAAKAGERDGRIYLRAQCEFEEDNGRTSIIVNELPYQVNKARLMEKIAELAKEGFQSSNKLLELEKGIYDVFIQTRDRPVDIPPMDFSYWEIKRNGFKPYAACRATHASIQSSRKLASQVAGRKINKVHIKVHPNVAIVANNPAPQTPLAHKFSVRYCVAMGLTGYRLVASDFNEKLLQDKKLKEIAAVSEVEVVADQPQYEAHLTVHVEGEKKPLHADTLLVLGHADNPMSEDEVWGKFDGLVAPVLGSDNARKLYDLLKQFEAPGNLERFTGMVARG